MSMGCCWAQAYQRCPAAGPSFEEALCLNVVLQYEVLQQAAVNDDE